MKIIKNIQEMKDWARDVRKQDRTIGFVPTMGCLHEGHLSLAKKSLSSCDITIASIFINPTQFGPKEDYNTYPVRLEKDKKQLKELGVDVLFLPLREDIFPEGYKTYVSVEEISLHLCGKSRPEFFKGVSTIVLKLLNIVQPDTAYFGEKDRQQLEVINAMVKDLNLDTSIIGLPIVRESDGLAVSSRNLYLSGEEHQSALSLHKALETAQELVRKGESSAEKVRNEIREIIESEKNTQIDYISVCDPKSFTEKKEIKGETLIALAVQVGKARLIDNCLVERN